MMTFNTATIKKNDETTNNYPFIENKHVTRKETDFPRNWLLLMLTYWSTTIRQPFTL